MIWLALLLILQGALITVDEFYYHRQRGLPLWERVGHPIDTFSVLLCLLCIFYFHPLRAWPLYLVLVVVSCLLITKDEWVHANHCCPTENWIHSLLFILHPIILGTYGILWWQWKILQSGSAFYILGVSFIAVSGVFIYQILYWNFFRSESFELP